MFASHHKLDNLIAIVDHNKLQSLDRCDNIISLSPFAERWKSFGWAVKEIDGHNMTEVVDALESIPFSKNKPSVIIANTIKGKGISFMENVPIWHYRLPNEEELKIVLKELDIDERELGK
jgi:transketolase